MDNQLSAEIAALKKENDELQAALNKIGLLAMSEHAYTSEFTERVRGIVNEALDAEGRSDESK